MPEITAPVPDPRQQPKLAAQMAREGEQEGDVLVERDHSQSAPEDDRIKSRTPTPTAPNGE